ncbi:ABC transporter permease [Kiritimatiella glycovorans]|uniref:Glycine betaine transport system permease protein OpuAB n=1 Tax=Kiritimatiella glycovorans TaxID=1307763 RepID=A0A0G3EMQ1_9BACT|nr:proline/glycine betaine ABC transporter permease [Kiritimatiella glycovorans]AKJ65384.1 Glycine betaine transport system permease protein OpuAB [Kiritimatiella glycovorans]
MIPFTFHLGPYFEKGVDWLLDNFEGLFNGLRALIDATIGFMEMLLNLPPALIMIIIISAIAWKVGSRKMAIFTFLGLFLIALMELWAATMQSLALVLAATFFALLIGIPLGIVCAWKDGVERVVRPILDFMQTMPAYVYLIPAILFFQLGNVPGAVATVIFAMPPAVRLTNLGIRQLPSDVMEAAESFGSTPMQQLVKVQLPMAMPSILAGVNQTIMLSLSMVVIAAMIGAEGLGKEVYNGITRMEIGQGFEAGIAIVILAMILDRITYSLGSGSTS